MTKDPRFARAVVAIQKRAEKQTDWSKLFDIFVRSDLWDRAHSLDSQLVLGRRGTGKTHLFRVLHESALAEHRLSLFVDCTSLGSGIGSLDVPPATIAAKYFVALLNQIGTDLLDQAIRMEMPAAGRQDRILNWLSEGLVAGMSQSDKDEDPTFNYRQIRDTLEKVIDEFGHQRVQLTLDEWAQVPLRAQPFLAEFIKRGLLSVPSLAVKILAVNYQFRFSEQVDGDSIGLERGSDIPDVLDMDRYLIFDETRDFVTEFFGKVLYNHLGAELDWDLGASGSEKFAAVTKLFTGQKAFTELVRAAEGNTRDFLCIFSKAYFDEFRQSQASTSISIPNVTKAAAAWYESEKSSTIMSEPDVQQTLAYLMNSVLKPYKSRTFLVEQSKAQDRRLERLLNERVLHKLNHTYSHPDKPGVPHEIFTIDYGAYVRFRNTVNEVHEPVFWEVESKSQLGAASQRLLVPVDDKRSIRRIIFDPESLAVDGDDEGTGLFAPRV